MCVNFFLFRDEPSDKEKTQYENASTEWQLDFFSSPSEIILDHSNQVTGIRVEKNELIEVRFILF